MNPSARSDPSRPPPGPQVVLAGAHPTGGVPPLPSTATAAFRRYQKSDNCDKLVRPGNLPNPRKGWRLSVPD